MTKTRENSKPWVEYTGFSQVMGFFAPVVIDCQESSDLGQS